MNRIGLFLPILFLASLLTFASETPADEAADASFATIVREYVESFPALSPITATTLGDHRFDGDLNDVAPAARAREVEFCRTYLERLDQLTRDELSRDHQVDHALLDHQLRARLWKLEVLREWEWNPLIYTELAGSAVYGLMAREFAPLPDRLQSVTQRLEAFPRFLGQIRATLKIEQVPPIHAQTAVKQNRGVLSILDNMVVPHLAKLPAAKRDRLVRAIDTARNAVEKHQKWLESDLLSGAAGDFRIGAKKYDRKLFFTLQTPLSRAEVRERATAELSRVRREMYRISQEVYSREYPYTTFPETPTREYEQAIIRAALEMAYRDIPEADAIVSTAKESLRVTTEFVKQRDLISVPNDPLEIIVMPEFQRGVSLAYCDSPGPLDVGQKTFYAVAPLPKSWDEAKIRSFLREYNIRSIHDLTIHEAMPGHFLQLAHSNRYPGKLRAVLSSGTFIEGWAVYAEQMMAQQGFLDGDPLMRLIALKWYLRGIANAILDQAVHTEGITRDQAMRLMMEDTFQEEREAAGKWIRAQLTSAQLSTYFVGYLEHVDLRRETEQAWGDRFKLKTYHDAVLAHGSPPVQYARALLLNQPIP